ncbi:hypothetical protein [Ramlibacter sp. PS4R-6]|uniref:hypothetical protein n=1 Tax=Ramlibacter sp. PS4R-6 TaxID=3133438 RepID=UPI0030B77BA3
MAILAAVCTPADATSPPSPPPPTVAEIVSTTQAVFIGRVESVTWQPIVPSNPNAGLIAFRVTVTERLLGEASLVPKRITYVAGSVSMAETQSRERYAGKSFIFVGHVFPLPSGEAKIMVPPSGELPHELLRASEFRRALRPALSPNPTVTRSTP